MRRECIDKRKSDVTVAIYTKAGLDDDDVFFPKVTPRLRRVRPRLGFGAKSVGSEETIAREGERTPSCALLYGKRHLRSAL